MYPKKDNTLSLLGGAALGAIAMYLLDPEAGHERRRDLAERTGDASHRAGEALQPIFERVSDAARSYSASLAAGASTLGHAAVDKLDEFRAGASDAASHLGEHASDVASNMSDSLKRAAKAPAHWFKPEPEPSHAGAYAATGFGAVLLGAAAMYVLDPERGRERRAMIMDQLTNVVRRTGQTACRMGQNLRNRAGESSPESGIYRADEDAASAEKLLQSIRSELPNVVSHAGSIQVMTDNHGRVTLHGKVLAGESDKLLATVRGIAGVTEVINLLSTKNTEQEMTDDSGTTGESVARM